MSKIVIIGARTDPTVAYICQCLRRRSITFIEVDLLSIAYWIEVELLPNGSNLIITTPVNKIVVSQSDIIYSRLYTKLFREPDNSALFYKYSSIIAQFLESTNGLVVNRPTAGWSNFSKPLHYRILEQNGFKVPKYIVSSSRKRIQKMVSFDERWVSKGISGHRTQVSAVDIDHRTKLRSIRHIPVLMQERVYGDEYRIHVIGSEIISLKIECNDIDYRENSSVKDVQVAESQIPVRIRNACLNYCLISGLAICGFDFIKCRKSGEFYVLEANPSPGIDFFDKFANSQLIESLIRLLTNRGNEIKSDLRSCIPPADLCFIDESRVKSIFH